MLPIIKAPNEVLAAHAKKVEKIDGFVLQCIEDMKETLDATKDPEGVGLAAPQIGKSLRIFIMKPSSNAKVTVCINPVLIEKSEKLSALKRPASRQGGPKNSSNKRAKALEGCLSLYNIWGPVLRAPSVTMQYMDEKGVVYVKEYKGFPATIVQHEIDHLDGILFPKRVLEQKGKLYQSSKDENGEDVFEPLLI